MKTLRYVTLLSLAMVLLVGCMQGTFTPEVPEDVPEEAQPLVRAAMLDLVEREQIEVNQITVEEVTETEFSDTSLGVPEPGQSYAQIITPGYVIVLEADGEIYQYHGAETRVVFVPEEYRE
jgi:hypothetical protein